jgi:hypothetical protein
MSVGTTALIVAGVSAAASIGSAAIGANASENAASQQANSADKALAFQESTQATNQANYAPYLAAGSTSVNKLMTDLNNGTFGPGSNPTFTAPTADQARSTPGYQFTLSQGERGVNASAAAAGGALSGGAVKSSEQYASGLADSTYNDVYNRSLSTYQAQLANQAQEYSQLYQPAALGENAAAQSGNTAQQVAGNVGSLMTQVGNAQAAGTIGVANATAGGVTGVASAAQQAYLLNQYGLGGTANNGQINPAIGNGGAPIPSSYADDGTAIYSPA